MARLRDPRGAAAPGTSSRPSTPSPPTPSRRPTRSPTPSRGGTGTSLRGELGDLLLQVGLPRADGRGGGAVRLRRRGARRSRDKMVRAAPPRLRRRGRRPRAPRSRPAPGRRRRRRSGGGGRWRDARRRGAGAAGADAGARSCRSGRRGWGSTGRTPATVLEKVAEEAREVADGAGRGATSRRRWATCCSSLRQPGAAPGGRPRGGAAARQRQVRAALRRGRGRAGPAWPDAARGRPGRDGRDLGRGQDCRDGGLGAQIGSTLTAWKNPGGRRTPRRQTSPRG